MSATVTPLPAAFRRVNRGRNHSYELDGRKVPGVTTLIGDGVPKKALPYWSARLVAEHVADHLEEDAERWSRMGRGSLVAMLKQVPWDDRDEAANRGTEVHDLARAITEGREVEPPDELVGHVDGYLAFLEDWQPADELVERPVLNRRYGYAGTFDLLCSLPTLGRCLIDVKTGRSGIWPETALQLAAYRRAEVYEAPDGHLEVMPPVDHTLGLWVHAEGYELHPVVTDDEVFRTFLYAADVAKRFTQVNDDRSKTYDAEAFILPALPRPEVPA